jgi:hypothetical protein
VSAASAQLRPQPNKPVERSAQSGLDRAFALTVRMGQFKLRPSEFVDDELCRLGPLGATELRRMVAHPAFRAPISRALSSALGIDAIRIGPEFPARLASSPRLRLAVLLATEPIETINRVAGILAAAVLSRKALRLVLKSERERARETLGLDGFEIATHETSGLHLALSDLDCNPDKTEMLVGPGDLAARRESVLALGFATIGRFLDTVEPLLVECLALRLPASLWFGERHRAVAELSDYHCEHVVKLVRRRQQQWLAIIG